MFHIPRFARMAALLFLVVWTAGSGDHEWRFGTSQEFEEDRDRPRPDGPDGALKFRRLQQQDENGDVPPGVQTVPCNPYGSPGTAGNVERVP